MPSLNLLFHVAQRLETAWQDAARDRPSESSALKSLYESQETVRQTVRTIEKARRLGLSLILPQLRLELLRRLKDVGGAAQQAQERLEPSNPPIPTTAFFIAELKQLEEEFSDVRIGLKAKTIRVTTEPITLEGVYLGPFALQFSWERYSWHRDIGSFEIIALESNPAAADESVTHPHVKDRRICAGDAKRPLQKALDQGRIADAFCLLKGVLLNYNSDSPHISLDKWYGSPCYDCGGNMDEDDQYYCSWCDHAYCDSCASNCFVCHTTRCRSCLTDCAVCRKLCCSGCLKAAANSDRECCSRCLVLCARCGAAVASDELSKETKFCPACQQSAPSPEGNPTAVTSSISTHSSHAENDNVNLLKSASAAAD